MSALISFVRLLDAAAEALEPLIQGARPGSSMEPDAYALAWWSSLRTMFALLSPQRGLTAEQYSYLHRELFGGKGSFQEFSVDEKRWGETADAANERLGAIRDELYSSLVALRATITQKI